MHPRGAEFFVIRAINDDSMVEGESERLDALTLQCHMRNMVSKIRTVCVYCGSGPGTNPRFVQAANSFGKLLAENGIGLVYGGCTIRLNGAVGNTALEYRGTGTGISS